MIYKSRNLAGLMSVVNKVKLKTFNIETQYKFLKIIKVLTPELQIYNEQRNLLLAYYAARDNEGKPILNEDGALQIIAGKEEECLKKIEELNELEISFQDIYFSLNELEDLGLTLEDLIFLEPFIKS